MQINTIEIYVNGAIKIIDSREYNRQRRLELLSSDSHMLLDWLIKRGRRVVSMAEISKCLTPLSLRHVDKIRHLVGELVRLGFITAGTPNVIYSGRKRKESWTILDCTI